MRTRSLAAGALALVLASTALASAQTVAPAAQAPVASVAQAGLAQLTFGANPVPFQVVSLATNNNAGGAYSTTAFETQASGVAFLPAANMPSLRIAANNVTDAIAATAASGSNPGAATAGISFASGSIAFYPASGGSTPLFSVAVGKSQAVATYAPSGTASTAYQNGTVTISGSLMGSRVVTVPANSPKDTLAFNAGNVKVYVNYTGSEDAFPCPACSASPNGVAANVIRMVLDGVNVNGTQLSGTVYLGRTEAY
jgi:hypothetical protein